MTEQSENKKCFQERSYSFGRNRKLKSRKVIKELFHKSSSVFLHPFKITYLPADCAHQPQILISVSKKNFKKAVTRNYIRRQITEAYRLSEPDLGFFPCQYLALNYIAKEVNTSEYIKNRLVAALKKLLSEKKN
jgi:ribonuclease P protein component